MKTTGVVQPTPAAPAGTQHDLAIYSTAPQSSDVAPGSYLVAVRDAARWSERQGCTGILIYADNRLVDPWMVAGAVVQATHALAPLVAVQPVYTHPYTIAKTLASFGHLYRRRFVLNLVAGGFRNDLLALGDETPHDRRYDRLFEYAHIVRELLRGEAVTFDGEFYTVRGLRLAPVLDPALAPGMFVSASSSAGQAAARRLGATAIKYPKAAEDEQQIPREPGLTTGLRVGIIAREDADLAWNVALRRFPPDRKGELLHALAMKTSDSHWHRQLSEMAQRERAAGSPYWLVPFEQYHTFCPYLVGSYEQVAAELGRYVGAGFRTFILDIPREEDDLYHARVAFERAAVTASA